MKCPKCKHDNPSEALFCMKCGTKLERKCPECGAEYPEEALFCMKCGTRLRESVSSVPKLEDMHAQLQSLIPDALAQKYLASEQQAAGENRPITALFADISGFTPLSASKTSEVIFQLVQDCFKSLVSIVANYEGSISGFRGDGLLALFGAPIIHENDAERAILSALDMLKAMHEKGLQVSIGINTAQMTVGEIQTQLHREYTAYGTDINLAKRLQEAAKPGQILAGEGTYRLTRRAFDFETLSSLVLKGFANPVTGYLVQQIKVHPEKLRGIEGLWARMIGREHEFTELKDAVDEWLQGHGQIASIIGEAGIGKSRLVREIRECLEEGKPRKPENQKAGVLMLEGRCVSIGQPISYWPFIDILKTFFSLKEDDDPATIAHKVTDGVKQIFPQSADEALPFIGNLLSIQFGNDLDNRLKFATPEQIKHQTLIQLRDFFEALAKKQPLLLILEDLHWADDLSLSLISLLMDELAHTPLMLLCVYRPDREHQVINLSDQARRKCHDRYTEIMLKNLTALESQRLVEELLTIDNLPDRVKKLIMEKSEGNPFFIEEVIRSLIDRDLVYREDNLWKARSDISEIDVPDTIQSVILARVDRLQAEAKYVLQCASVIGRLFKHRLLEHLTRQERELENYLKEFQERDLVYRERILPELEYVFKHALTQETTYQSILEQRRQEFHHHVAVSIEKLYHERLEEYYEELALHYSRSGDIEKTVEYSLKSGQKAMNNYANDSAISHFQKVLNLIEQHGINRVEWKFEATRGLAEVYNAIGKVTESIGLLGESIELAKQMKLPPRQIAGLYNSMGHALFWLNRFDEKIRYGEMGLEILGDDNECLEALLMYDGIAIGSLLAKSKEKFAEYILKIAKIIKKLEYSKELGIVYLHISMFYMGKRDFEAALAWYEELEKLVMQHHDLPTLANLRTSRGQYMLYSGDFNDGVALIQKSLELDKRIGNNTRLLWSYIEIGRIFIVTGRIDEARTYFQYCLEIENRVGYIRGIEFAYHYLGEISGCEKRQDEAIEYYKKAIEMCSKSDSGYIQKPLLALANIYYIKGDYEETVKLAIDSIHPSKHSYFSEGTLLAPLNQMEMAYNALGMPKKFIEACNSISETLAGRLKESYFQKWYLEPDEISESLSNLFYADDFDTGSLNSSWKWIDKFGDSNYKFNDQKGLKIYAANGRDFLYYNSNVPRLMQEFSGNFAVEVCVSPVSDQKPQMGGLLIWKDEGNFLHLETGVFGKNEIHFNACINWEGKSIGRGILPDNSGAFLRIERTGDRFYAYCSIDRKNWMTCGSLDFHLEDPIQVGIHAMGMIDRTIYCDAFKEGTGTLFREFRIWNDPD